jgi:hypothetical protein
MNAATYSMVGTTDEQTYCDCCGKKNLKKTIVLKHNDTGAIVRYGSNCAEKATKMRGDVLKEQAAIAATLTRWQEKGFSAQEIMKGFRWGYSRELRNNKLTVVFNKNLTFVLDFTPAYDHEACLLAAGWI